MSKAKPNIFEIDECLRSVEALYSSDAPEAAVAPLDEWMADLLQQLDEKLLGYKLLIKKAEGDRDYNAELVRSFQAAKARHNNFREFLRETLARFMDRREQATRTIDPDTGEILPGETFLRSRSATVQLRYTERKIEVEDEEALVEQGYAHRYSVLTMSDVVTLDHSNVWLDTAVLIFRSDTAHIENKVRVDLEAIGKALDDGEVIEGIKVIPPKPYIVLT